MNFETNIANYDLAVNYARHLHEAELYDKSYTHNKNVARYAAKIGDLDRAERCYRTAIDDAVKLNKKNEENVTLEELTSDVLKIWGRYDEALSYYDKLSVYFSGTNDLETVAKILRNMGDIYARTRENAKALEKLQNSLRISETLPKKIGVARTLHEIGNVYRKQGKDEEAMKKYTESLGISKEHDDKRGIARTLHEIGNVFRKQGKDEEAMKKYTESLGIQYEIGNQVGIARTLHEIGNVYRNQGKNEKAMENYEKSLSLKKPLKVRYDIAITEVEMGTLLIRNKRYLEALPLTIEAHLLLKSLDCDTLLHRASLRLNEIQASIGVAEYEKRSSEVMPEILKRFPELNQFLV